MIEKPDRTGPFADWPQASTCWRCGRADGLDAVVDDEAWTEIREAFWRERGELDECDRVHSDLTGGRCPLGDPVLCLWCLDEFAPLGTRAALYFSGWRVHAVSDWEPRRPGVFERLRAAFAWIFNRELQA